MWGLTGTGAGGRGLGRTSVLLPLDLAFQGLQSSCTGGDRCLQLRGTGRGAGYREVVRGDRFWG